MNWSETDAVPVAKRRVRSGARISASMVAGGDAGLGRADADPCAGR